MNRPVKRRGRARGVASVEDFDAERLQSGSGGVEFDHWRDENDGAIAAYFAGRVWSSQGPQKTEQGLPPLDILSLEKVKDLRYGENPHQRAALYARVSQPRSGVAGADVLILYHPEAAMATQRTIAKLMSI